MALTPVPQAARVLSGRHLKLRSTTQLGQPSHGKSTLLTVSLLDEHEASPRMRSADLRNADLSFDHTRKPLYVWAPGSKPLEDARRERWADERVCQFR